MNKELSKKEFMLDERVKMVSSIMIMGYKGNNYDQYLLVYWCIFIKV